MKKATIEKVISNREPSIKLYYMILEILVLLSVCLGFKKDKMPSSQLYVSLNDAETSLYPEKMVKIALENNIHESHFGLITIRK